jgi:hypothetical protein
MYNQACNFLFTGFLEALKLQGAGKVGYLETIENLATIAAFFSTIRKMSRLSDCEEASYP